MTTLRELSVAMTVDPSQALKALRDVKAEATSTAKQIDESTKAEKKLAQETTEAERKRSKAFSDAESERKRSIKAIADAEKSAADAREKQHVRAREYATQFSGALKNVAAVAATAGAAIAGIGTALAAATVHWAKQAVETESTAKKYGISTEALGEYQFALKSLGGDADAAGELFKEMSIRLTEFAVTGAGPASDAMGALGLDIKELMRLNPEQRFERLADEIASVADAGQRVFLADSLFGEEGAIKGSALIEAGSKRIRELRDEARKLGGTLSAETVKSAKSLNLEMVRLESTIDGVKNIIWPELVPIVRDLAKQLGEWVRANKDLIASRLREFIETVVRYGKELAPIIERSIVGAAGLIDKIGGIDAALTASIGAWGAWQVASLAAIGPVGQAIAALAGGASLAYLGFKNVGDARKNKIAEDSAATDELGQYLARAVKENTGYTTGDRNIDIARTQFINSVIAAKNSGAFEPGTSRNDSMMRERNRQLANIKKNLANLDALWADDAAHAAMVDQETAASAGRQLNNLQKPRAGAAKQGPKSLEAIMADIDKQQRERDFYRAQEGRAQEMLTGASGPQRMRVERAIDELRRLSGQPQTMSLQELIAGAIGQGTGLGGGMLRPSGTGTTVNHIDASLRFELGGIKVEMPDAIARSGDPVAAGRSIGDQIAEALQRYTRQGFDAQRAQIGL